MSDADSPKETESPAGAAQPAPEATHQAAAPAAVAAAPAAAPALMLRFVNGEDEPLARAVAANRKAPNKKSKNGIQWRKINGLVMRGDFGDVLQARVTSLDSKVLSKRWWLICPADYPNRKRKIR